MANLPAGAMLDPAALGMTGVGIALGVKDGKLVVEGLVPGASADRSERVEVGDEVVRVDATSVRALSLGAFSSVERERRRNPNA